MNSASNDCLHCSQTSYYNIGGSLIVQFMWAGLNPHPFEVAMVHEQ